MQKKGIIQKRNQYNKKMWGERGITYNTRK